MKARRTFTVTIWALAFGILGFVGRANSQDAEPTEDVVGYSSTQLKKIRRIKSGQGLCLEFEAEFSDDLQGKPNAILDFELLHRIQGVISNMLDVVEVSPKKYRLSFKTDETSCQSLRSEDGSVNVTIDDAIGADGKHILPDQASFSVH